MSTKSKSFNRSKTADREHRAFKFLAKGNPATRRQIADEQGIEPGSISAAVNNLLARGEIAVVGTTTCLHTGRQVELLAVSSSEVKKELVARAKENKAWKISSLELELEQVKAERDVLKKRIALLVHMVKYASERDSMVSGLIKEFQEAQIKGKTNESK